MISELFIKQKKIIQSFLTEQSLLAKNLTFVMKKYANHTLHEVMAFQKNKPWKR